MYSSNATIEPRLIALLNEPTTPRIDLPPLQDPNVLKASGRPYVLEPITHTSNHNEDRNAVKSSSQKISEILSAEPVNIPNHNALSSKENIDTDRALGLSSPQSLRKILQVEDESPSQRSIKKRHRIEEVVNDSHKDEFVQLPQPPPKKQKAPKQVVPPIIIGLFEPPPNAALFPPIASSAFHDSHGRNTLNVNVPPEKGNDKERARVSDEIRDNAVPQARAEISTSHRQIEGQNSTESLVNDKGLQQKKASKSSRKKWSEEETNQLLLGVHKYGIGKWKAILNDPSFKFNDRNAPDLKDRFRTCCPAEIREQIKNRDNPSSSNVVNKTQTKSTNSTPPKKSRSTSSLMSENILIEQESPPTNHSIINSNPQSRTASPDNTEIKKTSRAHRRKLSDLASLGISGPLPFKRSSRKERRPFTEDEDNRIMKGYTTYGPQWAKIQADKDLGFKDRRSTDIRDRFRNRWKSIYENLAFGENAFAAKTGSITKPVAKNEATTTTTPSATSLPPLQSTESVTSSERPKIHRGHSFDLMALSSNSISNPYPLPTISSQTKSLPGKEIFYQLPNPSSALSSNPYQPAATSTSTEPIFTSSNEQSSFSYSQSNEWNDNILAPFNANGLGETTEVGMDTNENGIEEIVASFNPSSVGEMDIQRFLLDDTWPLK